MIDHDRLREVLHYDPETGVFTWAVKIARRIIAGREAGRVSKGYRYIKIDGTEYAAHRLAWFSMTGAWPSGQVDHRNRDSLDNAWLNLREATQSENNANTRCRNALGVKGVRRSANGKRFIAEIVHGRKTTYLGTFRTAEEAHSSYMLAARDFHREFARAS